MSSEGGNPNCCNTKSAIKLQGIYEEYGIMQMLKMKITKD
jgi:hypothetical protein